MDKAQSIQNFWSSFGIPAYDEMSVPDNAQMPYITYSIATDSIGNVLPMQASIWYKSASWKDVTLKSEEIARKIGEHGFYIEKIDGGYIWVTKGNPFAQRMTDNSDIVKRIYMNIIAEFLTAY